MILPPTDGTLRYSARTHVGNVRRVNEDALIALPEIGLWAVSDGMGGHAAGDFASQTVTEALATLPMDLPPGELMRAVRDAIQAAHEIIAAEAERQGGVTIGATVVVLLLAGEHFVCLWAGDSRLYRYRGGTVTMLSHDHSVVAELVEAGRLTWAEAERHPQASAITRAVGVGDELEIDKRRGDVLPGDRFLLCSDGLSRYADERLIAEVLGSAPIETVSDALLALALDGGGADNISIIVVDAA
ncbi:MAG: protein phosphatase 2C domain-containing protein [Thermohalobaculum sp.]|nr:protein phosphatase 2C domain-containing protein [Thermohalobaculum sp.]